MRFIAKCLGIHCRIVRTFYRLYYKKQMKMDRTVTFRYRFHIMIEKEGKLSVGANTFFNNDCSINVQGNIEIGANCLFGEGVKLYDHNHNFVDSDEAIAKQGFSVGSVVIGDNCWIGSNVLLLKGAKIGTHCVIAAGVVIDSEIPAHSLVKRTGQIERIKGNK